MRLVWWCSRKRLKKKPYLQGFLPLDKNLVRVYTIGESIVGLRSLRSSHRGLPMIHILQLRALAFVTVVVLGYGFPATTNIIFRWNDAQIARLQHALLPQVASGDNTQKYE